MPLRRPQPPPTQPQSPDPAFAVSCLALLHDGRDHIALVRAGSPCADWTLPGASPQEGEDPLQALSRAAGELTGTQVQVGELLVVEWVRADAAHGSPGGLNCIWDLALPGFNQWAATGKGLLGPGDRRAVHIADFAGLAEPLLERRVQAALSARAARRTQYLPPAY